MTFPLAAHLRPNYSSVSLSSQTEGAWNAGSSAHMARMQQKARGRAPDIFCSQIALLNI
jgi:hypothetical protein